MKIKNFIAGSIMGLAGLLSSSCSDDEDWAATRRGMNIPESLVESPDQERPKGMDILSIERINLNGDELPDLFIRHENWMITRYHGIESQANDSPLITYTFRLIHSDLPVEFRPPSDIEEHIANVRMPTWRGSPVEGSGYQNMMAAHFYGTAGATSASKIAKVPALTLSLSSRMIEGSGFPSDRHDTFVLGRDGNYLHGVQVYDTVDRFIESYNGVLEAQGALKLAESGLSNRKKDLEGIVGPFEITPRVEGETSSAGDIGRYKDVIR